MGNSDKIGYDLIVRSECDVLIIETLHIVASWYVPQCSSVWVYQYELVVLCVPVPYRVGLPAVLLLDWPLRMGVNSS